VVCVCVCVCVRGGVGGVDQVAMQQGYMHVNQMLHAPKLQHCTSLYHHGHSSILKNTL